MAVLLACLASGAQARPVRPSRLPPVAPPAAAVPAPELTVGARVRLAGARQGREPWCDFGVHARQFAGLSPGADPVFRTPSDAVKARYGVVRKARMLGTLDHPAALAQLRTLFLGEDGPSLARMGVQDPDPKVAAAALDAAQAMVATHPRVFALAIDRFLHPDPAVASAAVRMAFATGCDAPALYAMDALRHPDPSVQLVLVQELGRAMQHRTDIGLVDKLAQWLDQRQGAARPRRTALRLLGELGWLPATPVLERVGKGPQPEEAAEAFAALAVVAPTLVTPQLEAWLHDKLAVKRAAGARAVAQVLALDPVKAEAWLKPLLQDEAPGADPLAPATTVAQVAAQALAYVRLQD